MADPAPSPDPAAMAATAQSAERLANTLASALGLDGKLKDLIAAFGLASGKTADLKGGIISLFQAGGDALGDFLKEHQEWLYRADMVVGILNKQADAFGKLGEAAAFSGNEFHAAWKDIGPTIEAIGGDGGKKLSAMIGAFSQAADQATHYDNAILSMLASSGQLNETFGETGFTAGRIVDVSAAMYETYDRVAASSNLLSSEIAKYGQTLGKIPGIWGTIDGAAGGAAASATDAAGRFGVFDAILKVARGTGIDYADAIKLTDDAFMKLGATAERSVQLISQIGAVSQATNLRLEVVRGAADEFASSFQLIGDNMDGALTILGQFGEALQGKLGQSAIAGIAKGYVKGLTEMSLAHKSFISSASGGQGGLAGGLEVELMLRNKDIQGVQRMAEEAMRKQFGGRILTLEESAGNQELAGQFQMQRQMVKEFGLAGDDASAARVLEAMAEGVAQIEMPTAQDAVVSAINAGDQIQEAQYNELVNIRNNTMKLNREQARVARDTLQEVTGAMVGTEMGKKRQDQRDAAAGGGPMYDGGRRTAQDSAAGVFSGLLSGGADMAKRGAAKMAEANSAVNELLQKYLEGIGKKPEIAPPAAGRPKAGVAPAAKAGDEQAANVPGQGANYFIVPADSVVRIEIDMGDGMREHAGVAVRDMFGQSVSGTGGE